LCYRVAGFIKNVQKMSTAQSLTVAATYGRIILVAYETNRIILVAYETKRAVDDPTPGVVATASKYPKLLGFPFSAKFGLVH
jgi:hypothetical protein